MSRRGPRLAWRPGRYSDGLFTAVVLLIGLIARFNGFFSDSLWLDEAYTRYWTLQPLRDILLQPLSTEKFFTLLQCGVLAVFGDHDWALRLLPLLASLLAVPVIYRCVLLYAEKRVALVAAAFFWLFPLNVFWSRVGRGYTLLLLAATLTLYYSLLLTKNYRRSILWKLVGSTLLLLYSHKAGYFFAPLILVPIVIQSRRLVKEKWRILAPLSALILGCVPLLLNELASIEVNRVTFENSASLSTGGVTPISALGRSVYYMTPFTEAPTANLLPMPWVKFVVWVYLALFAVAVWRFRDRLLFCWIGVPPVFMGGMALLGMPAFIPTRTDLPLLAPLTIVLFLGIADWRQARRRMLALAALMSLLVPYYVTAFTRENAYVRRHDRANALAMTTQMGQYDACFLVDHAYFTYSRYLAPVLAQPCHAYRTTLNPNTALAATKAEVLRLEAMQGALAADGKVWVVAPATQTGLRHAQELVDTLRALAKEQRRVVQVTQAQFPFDWQGRVLIAQLNFTSEPAHSPKSTE